MPELRNYAAPQLANTSGLLSSAGRQRYYMKQTDRKGKKMARTPQQIRGMLYNMRSIIDGLIKILEVGAIPPDTVEDTLVKAITKEMSKNEES